MQTEILVTGATGNVGSAVGKSLAKKGITYKAADIDLPRVYSILGADVEAVRFSFTEPQTYAQTFKGVKKVFLMRPPQLSNVQRDMFPALEAAVSAGVNHIVFLSLINIENNPQAPHYKIEKKLLQMGVDTTFLRPSFFMQNLNTTHKAEIQERNEIFIPAGSSKTSFIDVRDIGAVGALALTTTGHQGQAYDLTGSEALSYNQVAAVFSKVLGRTITYRSPSTLQYILYKIRYGMSLPMILITAWLYNNTRKGMAERVTGEIEHLLGRSPISLTQYIEDYKEHWMPG